MLRPRRSRRVRRNTGYGLELGQLAALGAADAPELVVFPVNPLSLRWAAEFYKLEAAAIAHRSAVRSFLDELESVEPGARAALISEHGVLDEAALGARASRAQTSAAKAVLVGLGLEEEMAALAPAPRFGVLSGDGIVDAGFALPTDIKSLVLQLDKRVLRSHGGLGYPCQSVGVISGRIHGDLVAMGDFDEMLGMALLRHGALGRSQPESARIAAGIVVSVLRAGLWVQGQWHPKASLRFALPQPFIAKKVDATCSGELANSICTRHVTYKSGNTVLDLGFSADSRSVLGRLIEGEHAEQVQGMRDPRTGEYLLQIGGQAVPLELTKKGAVLAGKALAPVGLPRRECAGPDLSSTIKQPAMVRWLQLGVNLLMQDLRTESSIDPATENYPFLLPGLSSVVGKQLSPMEGMRLLQQIGDAMPKLRMSYVGALEGDDGVPRYLPAESALGKSYYGSPAGERALASMRLAKRMQFTQWPSQQELRKKGLDPDLQPPTFLKMALWAKSGDAQYSDSAEAIERFRTDYTLSKLRGIDDVKAQRGIEKKLWDESPSGRVQSAAQAQKRLSSQIPVEAIQSGVFTLWGAAEDQGYRVLSQVALSQSQILATVQSALAAHGQAREVANPDGSTTAIPFNPLHALRAAVAEKTGLLAAAGQYLEAGQPPAPFALVAAVVVDRRGLSKALPPPIVPDQKSAVGVYLAQLDVPGNDKRPKAPDARLLLAVHSTEPPGLFPARLPFSDLWKIAKSVTWTEWAQGKGLLPLANTPWMPQNIFSLPIIEQTQEFTREHQRLRDAEDTKTEGAPLSPVDIAAKAYYNVLTRGVGKTFIGARAPDVVTGGRRAHTAFGGSAGRAKRVGESEFSAGRMQSPDPAHREWATRTGGRLIDIFNFASSVCKQTGACEPGGKRRMEVGSKERWRHSLAELKKPATEPRPEDPVFAKFREYGIPVPDATDPTAVKAALVQLRDSLKAQYKHKMEMGTLLELRDDEGEVPPFFDEIAELNPRRRRSKRNPLSDRDRDRAVEYGKSRKAVREAGDLPAAFERLKDPESWSLTDKEVGALFPRRYKDKGTWSPEQRLAELGKVDFVQRVGAPDQALVRAGREKSIAVDPETGQPLVMPFADPDVMRLMAATAGLSLDEAINIINTQRGAQRITQTPQGQAHKAIPASSAICKMYRRVRLKGYLPPAAMVNSDTPRTHRALLLMSPNNLMQARVMSFRRGSQIDCDLVGAGPEDLPELLGRAIQSVLYWLVEKGDKPGSPKNRAAMTDVYVGRVGQPDLYLVHRAGEPISIGKVTQNLNQAQAGAPGFRIRVLQGAESERDLENYTNAVKQQFGLDSAREMTAGYRPSVGGGQAAPPHVEPEQAGAEGPSPDLSLDLPIRAWQDEFG